MVRIIENPQIFEWMIPIEREHIVKCSNLIRNYICSSELFSSNPISVGYFNLTHESSFVALIRSGKKEYIFKSDAFPNHSKLEALVLSKWKEIGISVPEIIETGNYQDIEYFLMKKIREPLLNNSQSPLQLITNNHLYEMGQILYTMHQVKGRNYGQINGNELIGEEQSISDYLSSILINKLTHQMLDLEIYDIPEINKLNKCMKLIEDDIRQNEVQSVLCHMDFYAGNVFNTKPLTIIDPDETIVCHPLIDLGSAIVKTLYLSFKHHNALKNGIIEGYQNKAGLEINEKILNAAIYTQAFRQMRSWYRKGKIWRVKYIKSYMNALDI